MKTLHLVVAGTLLCVVCSPSRLHGDSNIKKAKTDTLTLEKALLTFKANHGAWPDDLQTLAEIDPRSGHGALIRESMLLDPWGRPYHFDPSQVHPETGAILVWSDGPEPGEPDSRITNWPKADSTTLRDVIRKPAVWLPVIIAVIVGLIIVRHHYLPDGPGRGGMRRVAQKALEISILVLIGLVITIFLDFLLSPTYLD
jgi:hypothetical protein